MNAIQLEKAITKRQALDIKRHEVYGDERKEIETALERLETRIIKAVDKMFPDVARVVNKYVDNNKEDFYFYDSLKFVKYGGNGILKVRHTGVEYFVTKSDHEQIVFNYYMSKEPLTKVNKDQRNRYFKLKDGIVVKQVPELTAVKLYAAMPVIDLDQVAV
ncbi:hypothetical protein [Exiguobacterium sp. s133]|uniref:hypothetical protein n=1 Tax=Exiguobacterium sp. s133 TaxID=2751213 RepID=UPI001BE5B277|nr:hypothetical protein [Exiguobacterium sp. s133]